MDHTTRNRGDGIGGSERRQVAQNDLIGSHCTCSTTRSAASVHATSGDRLPTDAGVNAGAEDREVDGVAVRLAAGMTVSAASLAGRGGKARARLSRYVR